MKSKDSTSETTKPKKNRHPLIGVGFICGVVQLSLANMVSDLMDELVSNDFGFWHKLGALIAAIVVSIVFFYIAAVILLLAVAAVLMWYWPKGLARYSKFTDRLATKFWPLEIVDYVVAELRKEVQRPQKN